MALKTNSLGLRPYREVWELQKELQSELIAGTGEDTLIICEHPPVITFGKSAKPESLKVDAESLDQQGIELIGVGRGGDYTYHGPGQLIAYPILDLKRHKRDVDWYLRTLEEVVIEVLSSFGVRGERVQGKTGVWIHDQSKICSMGVRISRWCTLHGLALYVTKEAGKHDQGFKNIYPCGYKDISVISLEDLGIECTLREVEARFVRAFREKFGFKTFEESNDAEGEESH